MVVHLHGNWLLNFDLEVKKDKTFDGLLCPMLLRRGDKRVSGRIRSSWPKWNMDLERTGILSSTLQGFWGDFPSNESSTDPDTSMLS